MQDITDDMNKRRRDEHLVRRRAHGLAYREIADEFGSSKSTIHRKFQTMHDKSKAMQEAVDE